MSSERPAVVPKSFETLFREGVAGDLTDHQLLDRFEARSGEAAQAAFGLLMERHAGMVLHVCRNLLGNEHDAQDASQATFLVLAKKTRSIRNREAVGAWLHRVAVRIASKLKVASGRRKAHETRGIEMTARRMADPVPDEPWAELHEELERLPEHFRIPLVLCYLEGLTHQQAAIRLDWPVGTVESRLTRGRRKLRERLVRRGFASSAVLLPTASAPNFTEASVPAGWLEATSRAATRAASGEALATVASTKVASLTQGMLQTMMLATLKLGASVCVALGLAACGTFAVLQPTPEPDPAGSKSMPTKGSNVAAAATTKALPEPDEIVPAKIDVGGRVVGPDGIPVAGARLWLGFQTNDWTWPSRVPDVRATSAPNGRFAFTLADNDPEVSLALRSMSGWPGGFGGVQVVATADGFAPAWGPAGQLGDLKLKPGGAPIEGRLINLEGKPIVGAEVRFARLEDPANSLPLFCPASGLSPAATTSNGEGPFLLRTTTNEAGSFRLPPIGPGRRVMLGVSGPGIAMEHIFVASDSYPAPPKDPRVRVGLSHYGLKFEHPCKPGKSISGVVRDKATGAGLAGITVGTVFGTWIRATTDKDGRYRLDGLSKMSSYELTASARGTHEPYLGSRRTVDDVTGFAPIVADLEMVRGVTVKGRVFDRTSKRPVQAWVAYAALRNNPNWSQIPGFDRGSNRYHPDPGTHVPAMADGRFQIVVPPGSGFLVAHIQYQADIFIPAGVPPKQRPGAPPDALSAQNDTVPFEVWPLNFPAVRPVEIPEGVTTFDCDLTLDSGVVRQGTVLDPEGRPLSGVGLIGETFRNTHTFKTLTDPHFAIYALSADPLLSRRITLRHERRGLGISLRIGAKNRSPLEVRLQPLATLKGRLVDADGRPRTGASASLQLLAIVDDPLRGAHLEFSPPIRSNLDDDGRFHFDGVVPGCPYNLQCGPAFPLREWVPAPGEVKDLGAIPPER